MNLECVVLSEPRASNSRLLRMGILLEASYIVVIFFGLFYK